MKKNNALLRARLKRAEKRITFSRHLLDAQRLEIKALRAALKKARGEVSGKAILNLAGKGMKNGASLTFKQVQRVCASVVTQAANRNA